MNTHNDVKQEKICNVCGTIYSKIITEDCPVCKLRKELSGDAVIQTFIRERLSP